MQNENQRDSVELQLVAQDRTDTLQTGQDNARGLSWSSGDQT